MKFIIVFSFSLLFLVTFISCDANEPLPRGAVGLTLEDVSCTEAWMTLTAGNLSNTAYIRVTGNGKLLETLDVNSVKTTLYFDTLQPNTTYEFQAFSSQRGEEIVGNKLQFTTLDTTSHNFTWQTFEFGQHSSSTLYDVAIINENDIWAVGEIYMNDSYGNADPTCYNAVHWDGSQWELLRIPYYYNGQSFYSSIRAIYAFNENDIWFGIASLIHWNGSVYQSINTSSFFPASVNKMWGSSSNDLYIVGNSGNIAHYQNGSWKKIESGTTTNINDAWGITNEQNKTILYFTVSSFFVPGDKKILKIVDGKVDSVDWSINRIVYSCWTNNENFVYVCGEGVYVNKFGTWEQITLPAITTNSVRGNEINDVFAVGSLGTIFHFNGINWQVISSYNQKENYRVDFKNNIVAICGYYNGKGSVEIGRRN